VPACFEPFGHTGRGQDADCPGFRLLWPAELGFYKESQAGSRAALPRLTPEQICRRSPLAAERPSWGGRATPLPGGLRDTEPWRPWVLCDASAEPRFRAAVSTEDGGSVAPWAGRADGLLLGVPLVWTVPRPRPGGRPEPVR